MITLNRRRIKRPSRSSTALQRLGLVVRQERYRHYLDAVIARQPLQGGQGNV